MKKERNIMSMSNRMIVGFLLCAVVAVDIFYLRTFSIYFTDALILFFAFFGSREMVRAYAKCPAEAEGQEFAGFVTSPAQKVQPIKWIPPFSALLSFALFIAFDNVSGIIVSMTVMSAVALCIFTFSDKMKLSGLIATIAPILYPQLFLAIFYMLNHNPSCSLLALTTVLAVSICTDTMALFVGMTFKGPKLCPKISPKKTISGAIGGLLGGLMGSFLAYVLFVPLGLFDNFQNVGATSFSENNTIAILIHVGIGLVGGAFNQVGDLAASAIKRKVGIKDYSYIFPGHGGVMDRLDGMSFVLAAVYLFVSIVL